MVVCNDKRHRVTRPARGGFARNHRISILLEWRRSCHCLDQITGSINVIVVVVVFVAVVIVDVVTLIIVAAVTVAIIVVVGVVVVVADAISHRAANVESYKSCAIEVCTWTGGHR